MDWIILFQNKNDRVIFVSSLNPNERDSLSYYQFFEFINKEFNIHNFLEFKNQLDRFKVIYLLRSGLWEIIQLEEQEATFEELYKINGDSKEQEEKSITEKTVDKSKIFLNKIFDFRKKEFNYGIRKNNSFINKK